MGYQKDKITDSRILERGNGYQLLLLEGCTVTEIRNEGCEIIFSGKSESRLTISKGEDLTTETLIGHDVQRAFAAKDGSLEIDYSNGYQLRISPDIYEPWELQTEGSFQVVSAAGGGIAIWL